jgi:hypothetical protein
VAIKIIFLHLAILAAWARMSWYPSGTPRSFCTAPSPLFWSPRTSTVSPASWLPREAIRLPLGRLFRQEATRQPQILRNYSLAQ